MLKEELLNIRLSNKNISYYRKILNNENLSINSTTEVSSVDISHGSSTKVTGICDICKFERKITKKAYNSQTMNGLYLFTCSKKCSLEKARRTNLERWGVENTFQSEEIKEKIRCVNLEKFGCPNPQQSEEIKEKTRSTNLEKWGYSSPSKSDLVKDKVRMTNNIKFGVDYPAMNKDILEKMKLTSYQRYGVDNFSKTKEFKRITSVKKFNRMLFRLKKHGDLISSDIGKYQIKCIECGCVFEILHTLMYTRSINGYVLCTSCNPKKSMNIQQDKLFDFIKSNYSGDLLKNSRKQISKELDIFLPDLNLAIEFNGLYWHSDIFKDREYHLNKNIECDRLEIQLMHIWEDDWKYKREIVESIILNKIGKSIILWARNCKIKEIVDTKIVRKFLNINHLEGFIKSDINIGLYYNDELVSLMTFKSLKAEESKDWQLLRFCNKLNLSISGGPSKLISYFKKNYQYDSIISYSDNSISNGNMYDKMGFLLIGHTGTNFHYVINGIRRKYKNSDDFAYRIFNSGSRKWILN